MSLMKNLKISCLLCLGGLTLSCSETSKRFSDTSSRSETIERKYIGHNSNSGYTEAVRVGRVVYLSGQLSVYFNSPAADDPEEQVRQVWRNLEKQVVRAGGARSDIVKTTTYITDWKYSGVVNKVRKELFPKRPPTSTKIVVNGLAAGFVEINAVAIIDDSQ